MLALISNWKDPNTIQSIEMGNLEIEVTMSEKHSYKNLIPKYPVEVGFDISDNVKQQSPTLVLTGLTSNTPIILTTPAKRDENGLIRVVREDLTNRVQQTFNFLLNCAGFTPVKQPGGQLFQKTNKPKVLVIVTGLMIYRDMVISNLEFPRDQFTGESLPYSITFDHIRKVNSKYTTNPVSSAIPNVDKKAQKTVDKGKKQTKSSDSLALSLFNSIKGALK